MKCRLRGEIEKSKIDMLFMVFSLLSWTPIFLSFLWGSKQEQERRKKGRDFSRDLTPDELACSHEGDFTIFFLAKGCVNIRVSKRI